MKPVLLGLSDNQRYKFKYGSATKNYPLQDLYEFLSDKESRWIELSNDEKDPTKVIIWSEWNIKRSLTYKDFDSYDDFLDYVDRYHEYGRKRFVEVPAIRISRDNYEHLKQQFEDLKKRKPQYLIMREHDNGYVDILEKDELLPEDIAIMNREHKIYLNYLKRWKEYCITHPEKRSQVWHSSADNEFESDFALYDPIDEQGVD